MFSAFINELAAGRSIYDLRQLLSAQCSWSKINSHSESLNTPSQFPFRFRLIVLIIISVDYCVVVNKRGRVQMVGHILQSNKTRCFIYWCCCRCFVLSQEMNYGHFSGFIWFDSERCKYWMLCVRMEELRHCSSKTIKLNSQNRMKLKSKFNLFSHCLFRRADSVRTAAVQRQLLATYDAVCASV